MTSLSRFGALPQQTEVKGLHNQLLYRSCIEPTGSQLSRSTTSNKEDLAAGVAAARSGVSGAGAGAAAWAGGDWAGVEGTVGSVAGAGSVTVETAVFAAVDAQRPLEGCSAPLEAPEVSPSTMHPPGSKDAAAPHLE